MTNVPLQSQQGILMGPNIAHHLKPLLYGRGIMDSELLLKFTGYVPEYLLALSRMLLSFLGQPLSKHL